MLSLNIFNPIIIICFCIILYLYLKDLSSFIKQLILYYSSHFKHKASKTKKKSILIGICREWDLYTAVLALIGIDYLQLVNIAILGVHMTALFEKKSHFSLLLSTMLGS